MNALYARIDTARKFEGTAVPVQESVSEAEPGKTAVALEMARRASEIKREEPVATRLTGLPVPN